MPKSEQWEQSHIALAELSASRPVTDVREEVSYFTTNNYFASETEGLSLDIQKDQSLSSRTGESLSIAKELNQSPISPEDSVMGGTATLPPSAPPPPSLGLSPQHGTAIVADPRQHGPDMTRVSPTYPGQTPNGPVDFQDRRMSQFAPERTTPDPRPAPFSYDQRHALDTRLDSTFDRQQRPPAVPAIPQGTTPNVPSHMARPGLEPRSDSTKIPDILCNSRRSVEHDVDYKLRIRQQPVAARYCGFADRDRRVIGPPPIVQLMIEGPNLTDEELSAQLRGHYVMSCSIYDETGTRDASFMLEEYRHRRRLIGSLVATSFVGKDEYDEEGCFFCFPDLSCRTPGAFRLKFSLIMVNLARAREVKHFPVLVEAMSDGFTVYTAKDFPGMQESTKLTKRLKEQGRIISINKGADKTKNSRVLNESSEGEQDEGESC
ncbi:hypothetical protein NW759_016424 [Fusarium solani]|nr:hypothetical protein NW759_016424 [Fusarium solani]